MNLRRNDARCVYRSRSQLIAGIGGLVLYNLLAIATIAHKPTIRTIAFQVVAILFTTIVFGRLALAAIFVRDDKLRVINLLSSFEVKWDQIEHFGLGRAGILHGICRIYMQDGRVRNAFGVSESNYSAVRGLGVAQQMVEELNGELRAHQGKRSPQTPVKGLSQLSASSSDLGSPVLAPPNNSESFALAWLLIGALLVALWFLVPRLLSGGILGGERHGDAAVATSNDEWAPGCPARGVPPVESVRPAYLASLRVEVEETMHGRHGALYGTGVVDSEEPWSDSEPQQHFISRSKDGRIPGAFEMRWWAPNGDDIVADAFDFGTTQQAQDFFARAASQRCRDAGEQTMVPSPVGARDIAWINPDDARQVDVYLIRGRRVYRIADAPRNEGGLQTAAGRQTSEIVNQLACSLADSGCARSRLWLAPSEPS